MKNWVLSFLIVIQCTLSAQVDKPNVIFIIVDDLNDYIGNLEGHPQVETPNLDLLCAQGVSFVNAFSSSPGCAPSRASMLSGKDLHYTQVYNNSDYINQFRENFTEEKNNALVFTLPEILKDSGGYFTFAINKIYHNPDKNDYDKITADACAKNLSWNRMLNFDNDPAFDSLVVNYGFQNSYFNWGSVPDSLEYLMEDVRSTDTVIAFLESVIEGSAETCGRPFFLALGYSKPHSELYIPEKYYPEYYRNSFNFSESVVEDTLFNYPVESLPYNGIVAAPQPIPVWNDYFNLGNIGTELAESGEFENEIVHYLEDVGPLNPEVENVIADNIRASHIMNYIAAVQLIDAQIGRIMEVLNANAELKENTIIVLVSDHGYSLGEKKHWGKWGLWETDKRCPFIIIDPSGIANISVQKTVSYLDIFPTICALTNTPLPLRDDDTYYTDGTDISPLLENPGLQFELPAITTYKRTGGNGSCYPSYSIRNEMFHYIRYRNNNNSVFGGECDDDVVLLEEEFYFIGKDREKDPNEWNNLAFNEQYRPMINFLSQWLPDSVYYLKPSKKIIAQVDELPCLLDRQDTILLSAEIFEYNGSAITELKSPYQCIWFATWLQDTLYGTETELNLQLMKPEIEYADNTYILYAAIEDTITHHLVALTPLTLFIGDAGDPQVSYTIIPQINNGILISDIEISDNYSEILWDFGDGFTFTGAIPPVHNYNAPGFYTITTTLFYGNDCMHLESVQFETQELAEEQNNSLLVFPNPTSESISVAIFSDKPGTLMICNLSGESLLNYSFSQTSPRQYYIDVSLWSSGMYIVYLMNEEKGMSSFFIKQ